MKFLLIGFDGLRPDMITEEIMPNLFEFSEKGAVFEHHRCVFPSETYVNTASMMTGTFPNGHGIVANFFLDPYVNPREWFAGYSVPSIEQTQAAYHGKLFDAPSLGEILGDAGRRLAVISTNSAGSVRLKHHKVREYPHLNLSCHSPETSFPQHEISTILSRFGRLEERVFPDFKGMTYQTDVFLGHLCSGELPDVTVLWYAEPDNTYHSFGVGSEENLQALRHTDAEFGRIFDWWSSEGIGRDVQMMIASDHAHITQTRKISLTDMLTQQGFTVGKHLEDGADVAIVPGYSGNLLVRNHSLDLMTAVSNLLMDSDCTGLLFTKGQNEVEGIIPGTFSKSLVLAEHRRSPDLLFVLNADDEQNDFGYQGTCYFDNEIPVGGGIHGGLHPGELNCVLMAMGSFFQENLRSKTPSGIVDILPTMLTGLELPIPEHVVGRVLYEALQKANPALPEIRQEAVEVGHNGFRQRLDLVRVGHHHYIDAGKRLQ